MKQTIKHDSTKSLQPLHLKATVALNTSGEITYKKNNKLVVDLIITHPVTKMPKILKAIKIKQSNPSVMQSITSSTTFMITISDIFHIDANQTADFLATIIDKDMGTENQSIPDANIKANYRQQSAKDKRAKRKDKNSLCKNGKFNVINEKKNLHTKPNLRIIGNSSKTKSPSVIIDNTTNEILLANRHGSSILFNDHKVKFKTNSIDMGTSKKRKTGMGTGGMSGKENEMSDVYPKSNVLLSAAMVQPSYLPDITGMLIGIGYIYKIVKVIDAASDYVSASKNFDGRPKTKEEKDKAQKVKTNG